eukprot:TRINITY_DN6123_c0_g1_i2.p1 TRINITY_DN6123_c0_g1~~TRINITY_DN6123_c0_g1_i2.p1  ORF type:complete len:408 (-),score=47.96 TRINITY_DN6123_c0_g1_i2:418-1641(-)
MQSPLATRVRYFSSLRILDAKKSEQVDLGERKAVARAKLDSLASALSLQTRDDWYKIKRGDIKKFDDGRQILASYPSLPSALKDAYPEHEFLPWKFAQVSRSFWSDTSNQILFLEWIQKQEGMKSLEDWYSIKIGQLETKYSMRPVLERYSRSLSRALSSLYPDHSWEEWRFNRKTPRGFWNDVKNQRRFLQSVGKKIGVVSMEDWYRVELKSVAAQSLPSFFGAQYSWSLPAALKAAFPEHEFLDWKFEKLPVNYWDSSQNQQRYIQWLGKELGIQRLEQWYSVPSYVALESFTEPFGRSLPRALMSLYPHHSWDDSKFIRTGSSARPHSSSLRLRLLQCANHSFPEATQELSCWYSVEASQVASSGLGLVLRNNNLSLVEALRIAFPDHYWDPLRFRQKQLNPTT